eukprot:1530309-Karenia_brevis.AAC.1
MVRLMHVAKATGVICLMEHPEVPSWSRSFRCGCVPAVPHMRHHVINSFATPELRELSFIPHVLAIVFNQ